MAAISQLPTDHSPLVPVFDAITVDRVEEIARDDDHQLGADIDRVLHSLRAQFPRSAREALPPGPPGPAVEYTGTIPPLAPEIDSGPEL